MINEKLRLQYYFILVMTFLAVDITLLFLTERNMTQYILFAASILLVTLAYLYGLIEGMLATISVIFAVGTYLLYAVLIAKTIHTIDFPILKWFFILPLGAVLGGNYGKLIQEVIGKVDQANHNLTDLVRIDDLTGFNNETQFYLDLEEEIVRAKRYGTPLTLLVIQIEFFEKLETIYGEVVSKKAIKAISSQLNENVRLTDKKARIGPDRFAVILTNTSIDGAAPVKSKLKKGLAEIHLEDEAGAKTFNLYYRIAATEMQPDDDFIKLAKRAEDELQYDL